MEDSISEVRAAPVHIEKGAEPLSKWQEITESGAAWFFVDFSSMTVDGSLRSVWEVRDLKEMRPSGAWSYLCQYQYDCAERRYRVLSFSSQSGHMGEGQSIQSEQLPGEWDTDIQPDGMVEKIRHAVCGHPVTGTRP